MPSRRSRSAASAPPGDSASRLLAALDAKGSDIGLVEAPRPASARRSAPRAAGRKSASAAAAPGTIELHLVDRDGVLTWQTEAPVARAKASPRRGARIADAGRTIATRTFEEVAPDAVHAALQRLDDSFTPRRGLRRLAKGKLIAAPPGPFSGRTLLVIHGTFSNADNVVEDLQATDHGRDLLARAEAHYDRVLCFDHPTLAQGPLLNAIELNRLFAGSTHTVDIVCHSRGGLVTRWWLETLTGGRRGLSRAVLVGSPVAGTSLAAGPRIRGGIDAMTSLGSAVAATGQVLGLAAPFLAAPVGLLRILLSMVGTASRVPIPDALMAGIPGLFAQSRIGNNSELRVLRCGPLPTAVEYFTVTANFEPTAVGWRFWRAFRRTTAANLVADVVFDGANDLVVDTESMVDFGTASGFRPAGRLDFGTSQTNHHCAYFRDPQTSAFIRTSLRIP